MHTIFCSNLSNCAMSARKSSGLSILPPCSPISPGRSIQASSSLHLTQSPWHTALANERLLLCFLTLKVVKHAQVAQCVLEQHLFGWVKIPVLDDIASDCSDNLQLQQWTGIRRTMLSVAPQRADSQSECAASEVVRACLRRRHISYLSWSTSASIALKSSTPAATPRPRSFDSRIMAFPTSPFQAAVAGTAIHGKANLAPPRAMKRLRSTAAAPHLHMAVKPGARTHERTRCETSKRGLYLSS